MGMLDQVIRIVETDPLGGKLQEIAAILTRVQDPHDTLTEDFALRAIAEIVGPARPRSVETYQKPLG